MRIMAVDYGDVRTGLAISDPLETVVSPAGVITETNYKALTRKLACAVDETGAQLVVMGCPLNMDGSCGPRAVRCQKLARFLQKFVSVPVELWDERRSTVEADGYLQATGCRGQKRKHLIDQAAATVILQSYLAYRKNQSQGD